MTGRREAMADKKALPRPSDLLGQTKISEALRYLVISARSTRPVKITLFSKFNSLAKSFNICSSGPSPTTRNFILVGNKAKARMVSSLAFWWTRRAVFTR